MGSNPIHATRFARVVQLDQDTRLRTERLEVRVFPRVPSSERSSSGQDGALSMRRHGFDSRTLRQSLTMWASWIKPPDSQSGDRGFESRHRRQIGRSKLDTGNRLTTSRRAAIRMWLDS